MPNSLGLMNQATTLKRVKMKCSGKNTGFAFAGLMITASIVTLLAVIAIPRLINSRITDNESSARATLKIISAALEAYAADSKQGYPMDISALITSNPPYLNRNYVSDSIVQGYDYTCETLDINGYCCSAKPQSCGQTGSKIYKITTGGLFTERDCR
ncbi:MAG: hypothetical protein ABH914_02655 [Candidatus Omnitrophota bacterium]